MAPESSPKISAIDALESELSQYVWFPALRQKLGKLHAIAAVSKDKGLTQPIKLDIRAVPPVAVEMVQKWMILQTKRAFLRVGILPPDVHFTKQEEASVETPRPVKETAEMNAHDTRQNHSPYELEGRPLTSADSHPAESLKKKGKEGRITLPD